ncbi:hypothetical protein Geob_0340 [Geotalea daltonii FRC-32]|uniref:Uncharacterized protein n=1 Tax=Geotalea daltonii (strain DSM 22248 / JCM 15807 / FRC-32) TaxID=316067 RepID=B9LYX9_GEODF|nr:hypothetical protein [Geotalea daltonii]ACM18711.1 hypothetical protein Geob_0340 [Geotalea daltonii FRC-32]
MAQIKGTGILERGNIYFLYRPKVQKEQARGERDVERFYMVLSPEGKNIFREIIIGQKALPGIRKKERNWAFVKNVTRQAKELEEEFGELEYSTKTRGEREVPAARPAGEGIYAIVRHDNHTHLAYSLELPEQPRQVQRALNIATEGSYIISVKNPGKTSPPGTGLKSGQKAGYPQELLAAFRDRRFADADPPELLDYPGTELMLIGAEEKPGEELGIGLSTDKETGASADIFTDLKLNRKEHPVKPLFEGKWE